MGAITCRISSGALRVFASAMARRNAIVEADEKSVGCSTMSGLLRGVAVSRSRTAQSRLVRARAQAEPHHHLAHARWSGYQCVLMSTTTSIARRVVLIAFLLLLPTIAWCQTQSRKVMLHPASR